MILYIHIEKGASGPKDAPFFILSFGSTLIA